MAPGTRASRMQAVSLTCGVLFVMLFVYATRLIRVTDKLKMGIVVATGALACSTSSRCCCASSASGCRWSSARLRCGIGFSLFVVGLAAFNLLLDFDFIEKAAACRRPQVHGVVRRVRLDGHPDLAVPGDPPLADEAGRSAMNGLATDWSTRPALAASSACSPLAPCDASTLGYSVVT